MKWWPVLYPQACTTEKHLRKVIVIFQRLFKSNLDITLLIIVAHNGGTQIKGLYKLVSVTKGKLFASY